MTLRGHWLGGREKNAFTLVEILVALSIVGIVMAVLLMLLGQSTGLVASNKGYTVAQRAALSSVKLLPDEIAYAGEVEIISDDNHYISDDFLKDKWHYITRNGDNVSHIYWNEDNSRSVDEKIPGAERIVSFTFSPDAISNDTGVDIAKMLRVFAAADYGSGKDLKTVSLDRAILLHAPDGAMVLTGTEEDGEGIYADSLSSSIQGELLRYRIDHYPDPPLKVEVFESNSGADGFVYDSPRTWKSLRNFDFNTQLNAELRGSSKLISRIDTEGDSPRFMWIAVNSSELEKNGINVQPSSESLLEFLKEKLGDQLDDEDNREPGDFWDFYPNIKRDEDDFIEPFEANGLRILYTQEGERPENLDLFRMTKNDDGDMFDIGSIVGVALPNAYDYYKGAYMVAVVHYKNKESALWNMSAAYVKLGDYEEDRLFDQIKGAIGEYDKDKPQEGNKVIINPDSKSDISFNTGGQEGEAGFVVTTSGLNGDTAGINPQVILRFASDDFKHLIPKDGSAPLYGVTNYALYLDMQIPTDNDAMAGGYGVILNGTRPEGNSEQKALGYAFQFDPGAGGLPMRFIKAEEVEETGKPTPTYRDNNYTVNFGARPMYFYDAAKPNFPAPKEIIFFASGAGADTRSENFNLNAGASSNEDINYRTPFVAHIDYHDKIRNSFPITGRDFGFTTLINEYNQENYYGLTSIRYAAAVYSPKLMQSWHKYSGMSKESGDINDMGDNPVTLTRDNRVGFRWDRGWNVVPDIWKKRHILKLTVLELTQDVPKSRSTIQTTGNETNAHNKGDLFVRAELIQLKPGATNFYNARNYVYSKPIWFGKFKGDSWRGNDVSPFKKMGNRMEHIVSAPEPKEGDAQSYRRRSMRLRSWKDSFEGWDFTSVDSVSHRYKWRTNLLPNSEGKPLQYPGYLFREEPGKNMKPEKILLLGKPVSWDVASPDIDKAVWTPPIAVDLNRYNNSNSNSNIYQSGSNSDNTFGQYERNNQYAQRERKPANSPFTYAYNGSYTDELYGRLSLLLKKQDSNADLLDGLYALRGWDFGTSAVKKALPDAKYSANPYDSPSSLKRFLMVTQGLQLSYQPSDIQQNNDSTKGIVAPFIKREIYTADRERVMGLLIWQSVEKENQFQFNDIWLGEGFAPWEIREILGLKDSGNGAVSDQNMLELYQKGLKEENQGGYYKPRFADDAEEEADN
jgi:prepilin-type N-terminal cleavage/methylation domain-containing protein